VERVTEDSHDQVPQPPVDGPRLRAARKSRRLRLADVAAKSGLTVSYLSKLERNRTGASIAALLRVCDALDISIGELFGDGIDGEVVRAGEYPSIPFGGFQLHDYLLTPRHERRIQAIYSELGPLGGGGDDLYSLSADAEFVFVIAGQLQVTLADRAFELGAGDAMTLTPSTPHSFANPSSRDETRVLFVLSPALPSGDREHPGDQPYF
jgi:transcriptional regulator with XRE-family HTH domain